jgi:large subunit ribosomal protein L25
MERQQLKVAVRERTGKGEGRRLRREGMIPGILYGAGHKTVPVAVNTKELNDALSKAGSINALFDLNIGGKETVSVMVKDYQAHVLSREFLHVDFLKIDVTKKIHVDVPIHLVGKAPGVKEGGILEHITRKLEVICLPTSIPEFLEVDVSNLQIGDNLHTHDIKLPAGVEWASSADQTIAAVVAPAAEEEKPAVAAEVVQPEVIGEKKAEEGEAGKETKEAKPKEEKKEKKEKK